MARILSELEIKVVFYSRLAMMLVITTLQRGAFHNRLVVTADDVESNVDDDDGDDDDDDGDVGGDKDVGGDDDDNEVLDARMQKA